MTQQNAPSIVLPSECCISPEVLVKRLDKARASQDNQDNNEMMLAFDADGTLWSGDVGDDLFHALIQAQGVQKAAFGALVQEAETFGIAYSGNATEIAQTIFAAYQAGKYPEDRTFAMMAWVFAGRSLNDTIVFSKDVIKATNLEGRLHRFLDPVFDWARKENVAVWIVSASSKWMVEIGAAMFGIPSDHVIGMTPVVENGVIQAELAGVPIYGPNKPIVLREACPRGVLLGAFGDSSYDAALLKMAKVPVAVRPKPSLVACAADIPHLVAVGV
jgi:phosphatidylglycerophosphatase C